MNTCDLCAKTGSSVMAIQHGDKELFMCSVRWNDVVDEIFWPDIPADHNYYVQPESCETPHQRHPNGPTKQPPTGPH